MARTKTEYKTSKSGLGALFVLILLIAAFAFYFGFGLGNAEIRSVTFASTTVTNRITTVSFSTVTTETVFTTTAFSIVTVTWAGPENVKVSGSAKSVGTGTTATSIVFLDVKTQKTYTGTIANGAYEVSLLNHSYYNIQIKYTTAAGGVGGGQCSGLALTLFSNADTLLADWSC